LVFVVVGFKTGIDYVSGSQIVNVLEFGGAFRVETLLQMVQSRVFVEETDVGVGLYYVLQPHRGGNVRITLQNPDLLLDVLVPEVLQELHYFVGGGLLYLFALLLIHFD